MSLDSLFPGPPQPVLDQAEMECIGWSVGRTRSCFLRTKKGKNMAYCSVNSCFRKVARDEFGRCDSCNAPVCEEHFFSYPGIYHRGELYYTCEYLALLYSKFMGSEEWELHEYQIHKFEVTFKYFSTIVSKLCIPKNIQKPIKSCPSCEDQILNLNKMAKSSCIAI